MGMPSSKFGKEIPEKELQPASVPSTPILTPETKKFSDKDPRSPSLHISRTPLELLSSAAEKLEKFKNEETPIKSAYVLDIDPRSPTNDFKRTPIVIDASEESYPSKLHNKNLDKVRRSELCTSPVRESGKCLRSPKSGIRPRLLESSPIKAKPDVRKRRSLVGLLETNIDFTETDLDSVYQEKHKTDIIPQGEPALPEPEPEPSVPTANISTNSEVDVIEEIAEVIETIQVVNKTDDSENNSTDGNEIENIPTETHSAPVSPPSPILPSNGVKSTCLTPIINITADVKELDKKLTNLIYEDNLVVCPRIVKLKDNPERSPLRNCNGNENRVKSIPKLKVSDKPRRSDYAVSKIPVFKDKRDKVKNQIQCENTPPKGIDRVKHKRLDWDAKDNTLYL
ncbi:unnamed protein product [Phyllotreta striolata]|uniref:Uncharacterized protein n=1 Tax=Phyllotreta striolata TaxID=444603 RepID=A0A9N9TRZ9_PHYSR|nr:unnamed protein product [Phyllotreta striolata]